VLAAQKAMATEGGTQMSNMHWVKLGLGAIFIILLTALAPTAWASSSFAIPSGGILAGCTGEYFNNTSLSGSPAFVRTDAAINFYWPQGTTPGPGLYVDNYSVRWTCAVNASFSGNYNFNIVADDGMNVLVDGNLVIWAWYDQGPSSYSNAVYLNSGAHTVRVEYYNRYNGGTAQVSSDALYTGVYNPVPTTVPNYYPVTAPYNGYYPAAPSYNGYNPAQPAGGYLTNCTGEYFNNTSLAGAPALVRNDPTLYFFWREGTSPAQGIRVNNYSVRWTCPVNVPSTGTFTFNALTDDGMNVWVDNNLVIGGWLDHPPIAYSGAIYLNAGAHTVRVEYYNRTLGGTAQVSSNLTGAPTYYSPSGAPNYYSPPVANGIYAPSAGSSGLLSNCSGSYYNSTDLSGSAVFVRNDAAIYFYWPQGASPGPGLTVENYSVRWTCTFNVSTANTYTANLVTDDGMNLLIDGNLLIWAWYDQGPTAYSNSIYLNTGTHTAVVEYYNRANGGTAQVSLR
jgi:hypothetical protein